MSIQDSWKKLMLSTLVILAIGLTIPVHTQDKSAEIAQKLSGLAAFMEKTLRDWNAPGIGVGIVVNDKLVFAKGYGYRDYEKKLPITANTLFPIASNTKLFTAVATGFLVEEGKLSYTVAPSNTPVYTFTSQSVANITSDQILNFQGVPRAMSNSPSSRHPTPTLTPSPSPTPNANYRFVDLGTLGGPESTASSTNNSGQVVGVSDTNDGQSHAFIYNYPDGPMTDLNSLISPDSGWTLFTASGINDYGQIVGNGMNPDGQWHAYLYSDGTITDLGSFDARAINNNSQVAGIAGIDAVLWQNGEPMTLGNLGGFIVSVCCISDSGQVAGTSYTDQQASSYHAFFWDSNSGMHDLGPSGTHSYSQSNGFNRNGQVVGWMLPESGGLRAFLYSDGGMRDLGTLLSGDVSEATGINDFGQVIGSSGPYSEAAHAFLLTNGMQDLNDLVAPGSGSVFRKVNAINNSGQIVGGRSNNQQRAFLLTPIVRP